MIPPACQSLYEDRKRQHPDRMVVKMIEESFNEPFKTGALIDQHNNYAIFDILMNRVMFDYIVEHKLYNQEGQKSSDNANLRVDFLGGHHDQDDGARRSSARSCSRSPGKSSPTRTTRVNSITSRHWWRCRKLPTRKAPTLHRKDAWPGRHPHRPQDDKPSAMDLDVIRACRQRARAEGCRQAHKFKTVLQLLRSRLRRAEVSDQRHATAAVGSGVRRPFAISQRLTARNFTARSSEW